MSGEEEDIVFSPPTSPAAPLSSPARCSPPTSPPCHSPPTSPHHSTSSEDSETSTESLVNKGVKRKLHRTTLQRKLLKFESNSSDDDTNAGPENNVVDNQETFNSQEANGASASSSNHHKCENQDKTEESDCENSASDNEDSDSESYYSDTSDSLSLASGRSSESDQSSGDQDDQSDTSADTVYSLYSGAPVSAEEGLLTVFKLFINGRWTKNSFNQTVKAFKNLLPQPNEMPANGRAAFQRLKDLTSDCNEVPYVYCDDCLNLVTAVNDSCDHTNDHSKFYLFPIDEQVKHMFEQRGLASVIEAYRNHPSRKEGFICDILDGCEYLKVKVHFPNLFDLVILWNTDGVVMSGSSSVNLWPILGTVCEVPPRLRSSFMIVAGVYVGKKEPNMNVYLQPFVDSLKKLSEEGVTWVHPVSKEHVVSRISAPVLCADAPAKAKVLKMQETAARYACVVCEQKALKTQPILLRNGKVRKLRRFMFQEDLSRLRTGVRMDKLGTEAEIVGKPQRGVAGNSVISEIPHLDRGLCAAAEYMHLVPLGVVRYLLMILLFKKGPWFVGDKIPEMDKFIKSIKVPDFFNRLPRKLADIQYWKASDFRAFLLFYSLPLFKGRLPDKYFQHWLLLVSAMFILLKDCISENDLRIADLMLRSFVRDIKELYGEKCYTYNCHNLIHLSFLVKCWGPLWATSAFIFESFNGFLGNLVHGTKILGQELINNIKICQSVAILDNLVNARDSVHHHYSSKVCELQGKPLPKEHLKCDEERTIESCADIGYYVLHSTAKLMSKFYTTKLYDEGVKRANSIIQFKSDAKVEYGRILYFKKSENAALYCLVQVYKIEQVQLLFHENSRHVVSHLLPVLESHKLIVIPVQSIVTKVPKIGNYLGIMPNPYEVHL